MVEILPIKSLTDEDSFIFGKLNVALGNLARSGVDVAKGIVITPPELKLKTTLESFDFATREIFEQSLTLVKKELKSMQVPEILIKETKNHDNFLVDTKILKGVKNLWVYILEKWIDQIKQRLWNRGFYNGITSDLDPQVVIFTNKLSSIGYGHFDGLASDTVINILDGKLHPKDLQSLDNLIKTCDKKLFISHQYQWIYDKGVKITKVLPYILQPKKETIFNGIKKDISRVDNDKECTVKVFADLSTGFIESKKINGIYISSEKIFDPDKQRESFDNLALKIVESALFYPQLPILVKLPDESEGLPAGRQGMGKVRGVLRLLHQKSLLSPVLDVLDFARHTKGLANIHIVIPFVRGVDELLQIKRELSVKKLMRKYSLKQWLEISNPENIVNLEDYLLAGIDGVVFNIDELMAHFNGFDYMEDELSFYKTQVKGLLKFVEDSLKLLNKSKVPFLLSGSINSYPGILEFFISKGVFGIVVEKYEVPSIKDFIYQLEKKALHTRLLGV